MNRQTAKRGEVVEQVEIETDFTERVLLSLVFDVACLAKNVEQVKVKIYTLAKERGIKPPED